MSQSVFKSEEMDDFDVDVYRMALNAFALNLDIGVFGRSEDKDARTKWVKVQKSIAKQLRAMEQPVGPH